MRVKKSKEKRAVSEWTLSKHEYEVYNLQGPTKNGSIAFARHLPHRLRQYPDFPKSGFYRQGGEGDMQAIGNFQIVEIVGLDYRLQA